MASSLLLPQRVVGAGEGVVGANLVAFLLLALLNLAIGLYFRTLGSR